jgi:predicted DNA-binding protein
MLQENKDKKISIRISKKDYDYLQVIAYMAGMTVSKYIRTLCDASINAVKVSEKQVRINIEDIKAILNDNL